MPDPFDARARRKHFNRAVAQYHGEVEELAREINADIAGRGLGGQGAHPRIVEAFRLVNGVVEKMVKFDGAAAQLELKRLKAGGICDGMNPYSEEREQALLQWVGDELGRLPEGFLAKCRKLICKPRDLKDIARMVEDEVTYRIQRTYGERRASFAAETGIKKQAKEKRGGKPGRRKVYDEKEDEKLALGWDTAKRQGTYKADFARNRGYSLKGFDMLLARVRRRKRGAN